MLEPQLLELPSGVALRRRVLAEVTSGKAAYAIKSDARWREMLENQNIKIEIEKERVAAKKREEDFVFMTADTSHMDAGAKVWQHWYLFTFFG
jgi:hypothetical protein